MKTFFTAVLFVFLAATSTAQEDKPAPVGTTQKTEEEAQKFHLKELEEKVNELKEKIFDSKTRLLLLKEQILHNIIAEAQAVLIHKSDISSIFILEQALYHLDNQKIYFQDNSTGALDKNREFEIYNGSISPGNHIVNVEMDFKGNGKIFAYLEGYRFKVKSSYTFYASKGKITKVKIVGYEKGGFTAKMEDKPSIKFELSQTKLSKGSSVLDTTHEAGEAK